MEQPPNTTVEGSTAPQDQPSTTEVVPDAKPGCVCVLDMSPLQTWVEANSKELAAFTVGAAGEERSRVMLHVVDGDYSDNQLACLVMSFITYISKSLESSLLDSFKKELGVFVGATPSTTKLAGSVYDSAGLSLVLDGEQHLINVAGSMTPVLDSHEPDKVFGTHACVASKKV